MSLAWPTAITADLMTIISDDVFFIEGSELGVVGRTGQGRPPVRGREISAHI